MSENGITYREYWTEVAELAQSVTEEARGCEEDLHDRLHETIDGHQWIIYYRFHYDVLKHSANEDALIDELGEVQVDKDSSLSSILTQFAFMAFMADVREHSDFDAKPEVEDDRGNEP